MKTDKCWLCSSSAYIIEEIESPRYFRCPSCDLIFIDQKHILPRDKEKDRYLLHNNSPENKGYLSMLSEFVNQTVIPFNIGINTGLDYGCGPTPVLKELISVMGIEMDIYDPFFFNNLDFMKEKYDLIVSTEVFEHFSSPKEEIKLLASILKPNGILAVMTLFHKDSINFDSWWYRKDSTHICFYSYKTCCWIAEKHSLELLYFNNKDTCAWRKK